MLAAVGRFGCLLRSRFIWSPLEKLALGTLSRLRRLRQRGWRPVYDQHIPIV